VVAEPSAPSIRSAVSSAGSLRATRKRSATDIVFWALLIGAFLASAAIVGMRVQAKRAHAKSEAATLSGH
jgi:hypothetical protein